MRALGCEHVRSEQGVTEFGKDVVYRAKNIYNEPYYGAIVLKVERIHQAPILSTVQRQVQEAWTVNYRVPPDLMTDVQVHEVTVMTSSSITPNARQNIQAAMNRGVMPRVHFVDGEGLAALIRDVVKRAKVTTATPAHYEFEVESFHEVCERLTQCRPLGDIPPPTISAISVEPNNNG